MHIADRRRFSIQISLLIFAFNALGRPSIAGVEFYRSGFEGTDGGWSADADWDPAGDWERGVPVAGPFPGCFGNGPGVAFEGQEAWATRIDGCTATVVGNNFLRQTFDFTSVVNGTLSWHQFLHVVGSQNNRARVSINGDIVYESSTSNFPTDGYEFQSVDLNPYNNLPNVEIVFEMANAAVFQRPGWYIDDVLITSLVDPNTDDLGVLILDSPDPVTTVGNPITYTVQAVNHSEIQADNVIVTGTLDGALAIDAAQTDAAVMHDGSPLGGAFSINVGSMPPFTVQSFTLVADTTKLGFVTTDVSIDGDPADPNPANDNAAATTEVALITDLAVVLASDQSPIIDATPFNYEVKVTNNGPSAATGVAWSLTLPPEVTFNSSSSGAHDGTPNGGVVSGVIPNIPAGLSEVITVNATPTPGSLADVTAAGSVSVTAPDENDPNLANNTASRTIGRVSTTAGSTELVFTSSGLEFFSGVPLPTTIPPDLPDDSMVFFQRPHVSPNGQNWGMKVQLDTTNGQDDEIIVIVTPQGANTVVREGTTPMPGGLGDFLDGINSKVSINDAGCYAFSGDTTAASNNDNVIVTGCGSNIAGDFLTVIAREGTPIPGDPTGDTYSFSLREATLDNTGAVRFIGRALQASSATDDMLFETFDDGTTVNVLLQEGVSIPNGLAGGSTEPWDNFDQEFSTARSGLYVSGDGVDWLLRGDVEGDINSDDILVLNNNVLTQDGVIVDPVFTEPPVNPATGIFLAGNGDRYIRGQNSGGEQWVMKNESLIARTGDEIFPGAGEFWANSGGFPSGFVTVAGDLNGGYIIGGTTSVSPGGVLVQYALTTVAGPPSGRVVARAGDPVDLNGNGLFDDEATILFFEQDGVIILDDGTIIALLFIELPFPEGVVAGTGSGAQGVGKFPPGTRGACCVCDGTGTTCYEDSLAEQCGDTFIPNGTCADCVFGACCDVSTNVAGDLFDNGCANNLTEHCCDRTGGNFRGAGSQCQGDNNPDDGVDDLCTQCDPDGDGSDCNDGVGCTQDSCDPNTAQCVNTPDNAACDDNDQCSTDTCDPNSGCVSTFAECNDMNPCTSDSCDPDTGKCVFTPIADCCQSDAECDDGELCTSDVCNTTTGECSNPPVECNDQNPCTQDRCDSATGICDFDPILECGACCIRLEGSLMPTCFDEFTESKCNARPEPSEFKGDGSGCNEVECTGACCQQNLMKTVIECFDGFMQSECQSEDLALAMEYKGDGTDCADVECGGACCIPPTPEVPDGCLELLPEVCADFDDSTYQGDGTTCTPGLCPQCEIDADCADADLCNGVETCVNEQCQDGTPVDCDDGIDCTVDTCEPSTGNCDNIPNNSLCDDGDICIVRVCDVHEDCIQTNYICGACCTDDTVFDCVDTLQQSCEGLQGDFRGVGTVCEGLDPPCMGACCIEGSGCVIREPIDCVAVGETFMGMGTTCDDVPCGACCAEGTGCFDGTLAGNCVAGNETFFQGQVCAQSDCGACCDGNGNCTNAMSESECTGQGKQFRGPGSECSGSAQGDCGEFCTNDNECVTSPPDACHGPERCVENVCVPGDLVDCDDGQLCTNDSCNPDTGQCINEPRECPGAQLCDDATGKCFFPPCESDPDCDDGDPCTIDSCLPLSGDCLHVFNDCDDGDACTFDFCDPETGCDNSQPVSCEDFNVCTIDDCDPHEGCTHEFICGACCLDDGTCEEGLSPATCESVQGGTYQGDNSTCSEIECEGACCADEIGCVDNATIEDCDAVSGFHFGFGTDCDEVDCGACCLADGSCVEGQGAIECENQGGTYMGDGSTCEGLTCFGACCVPDDGCVDDTSAPECKTFLGIFSGPGSTCATAECGACCFQHPGDPEPCRDGFTPAECSGPDREYAGDGSSCADDACAGACCVVDVGCVDVLLAQDCELVDGIFYGAGSTCAGQDCGACCSLSINGPPCLDGLTSEECIGDLQEFAGPNTSCDQGVCDGACCILDQGCVDGSSFQECNDAFGTFFGIGSVCAGADCGACCLTNPTPEENCIDGLTQGECEIADAGVFQGSGSTCTSANCAECFPASVAGENVCSDGDVCNGVETCDPNGQCQPGTPLQCDNNDACDGLETCDPDTGCEDGTPVDCSDSDPCTVDSCDRDTGECDNLPVPCPDDGQFCNGGAECDSGQCVSTPPPCDPDTEVCDELDDVCRPDCVKDADCDDGQFCNGEETCLTSIGGCLPGAPPCFTPDEVCIEEEVRCRDAADLDGDGDVDEEDYAAVADCLGQPPVGNCAPADLDGNGTVDLNDVAILNNRFTGAL